MVSIDAYQYFGTDATYLAYLARFVKPGGQIGLVMPATMYDFEGKVPAHLSRPQANGSVFWDASECWTLRSSTFWRRHLTEPGLVDLEVLEELDEGWKLWRDWERYRDGGGYSGFPSEAEALETDQGRAIGFVIVVMRRRADAVVSPLHSLLIRLENWKS